MRKQLNLLIRPLLTYTCLTNLYFSNTQIDKFKSLDKRTKHIVSDDLEVNSNLQTWIENGKIVH